MLLNYAYHSVSDLAYVHAVQPYVLNQQYDRIKNSSTQVSQVKNLSRMGVSPANCVYVTFSFDDGLEDNLTNALPILKKHNIHATIFVATDFVGKDHTNAEGFTFRFLSWEQMRELESSGLVSIESHTHTHPLLTTLSDSELDYELSHSKQLIEDNLQKKVVGLAYPKGNFDARVKKFAAKYYEYATGPVGVLYDGETLDPYAIPRVIISRNIPFWKFRLMLTPLYWRARDVRDKIFR